MKLIVGLGNPGEKYEHTRHNLGFMAIEQFLKDFTPVKKTVWVDEKRFKGDIAQYEWEGRNGELEKIILLKPKTYMNNSGLAVGLVAQFYKIDPENIWVLHDELDLPIGSMKIRMGGSSAGHNGVASLMKRLGTEKFWRFRLGIGANRNHGEIAGQKIHNAEEYVLDKFNHRDAGKVRELIKRTSKALQLALEEGLEAAMNQYNTK